MKEVKTHLPDITFGRFEELATAMGLTVEDAAAEVIKERVKAASRPATKDAHLPTLEAQVFAQCVEAMSVLTEPDSIASVLQYLAKSVVDQMKAARRTLDIEINAVHAAMTKHYEAQAESGEPLTQPNAPAS